QQEREEREERERQEQQAPQAPSSPSGGSSSSGGSSNDSSGGGSSDDGSSSGSSGGSSNGSSGGGSSGGSSSEGPGPSGCHPYGPEIPYSDDGGYTGLRYGMPAGKTFGKCSGGSAPSRTGHVGKPYADRHRAAGRDLSRGDLPAELLGQDPHDREAQPAGTAGAGPIRGVEAVEEPLGIDPFPVRDPIGDLQQRAALALSELDEQPVSAVLHRIAQQVLGDPGEFLAVGRDLQLCGRGDVDREPGRLDRGGHPQQALAHQHPEVDLLHLELHLRVQQVRVLVQPVHECSELDALAVRGGEAFALDGVELGPLEQLEVAAHRGERGAQVVGDVCDEGADATLLGAGAHRGLPRL